MRKTERTSEEDIHLYGEDGIQLNGTEEKEELVRYWTSVYQQHSNHIDIEWNAEKQKNYIETVDNKPERSFPRELIEHLDMAFHIDCQITPMEKPMGAGTVGGGGRGDASPPV